ncbi:hypothetical protein AX14_009228 [Amanita brunnescens Koide BX004]|nr:hypothetical protein AX14_009228 [Amanita brunnescens Koide BX004]
MQKGSYSILRRSSSEGLKRIFRVIQHPLLFPASTVGIGLDRDWWIEPKHFVQNIVTHPHLCFGLIAAHTVNTMSDDGYKAKPNPMPEPSDWMIGYPVMVDYYTVLNWGKRQIGLGKLNTSYSFSSETHAVD